MTHAGDNEDIIISRVFSTPVESEDSERSSKWERENLDTSYEKSFASAVSAKLDAKTARHDGPT